MGVGFALLPGWPSLVQLDSNMIHTESEAKQAHVLHGLLLSLLFEDIRAYFKDNEAASERRMWRRRALANQ